MSANYPAAAFVIMMVTTVLLVPSSAAPTRPGHGSGSDADIVDSWWFNACGHHSILHPLNKKHHNRSDMQIFRIVKNQMNLFNDFFSKEILKIKEMYAEVQPFDNIERKSLDWLPKYMKPTNRNRSKTALNELHSDLQYYVVAVNYLVKVDIQSDAKFDRVKRKEIFVNVFNNIKSLICEVEAGVNVTGQTVSPRIPPDYPQQIGLAVDFKSIAEMYIHDTGVMYKLRDFIRKWNNNLMRRLPTNHKRESESDEFDAMENTPEENENSIIE